jgi:hypothetical protein
VIIGSMHPLGPWEPPLGLHSALEGGVKPTIHRSVVALCIIMCHMYLISQLVYFCLFELFCILVSFCVTVWHMSWVSHLSHVTGSLLVTDFSQVWGGRGGQKWFQGLRQTTLTKLTSIVRSIAWSVIFGSDGGQASCFACSTVLEVHGTPRISVS